MANDKWSRCEPLLMILKSVHAVFPRTNGIEFLQPLYVKKLHLVPLDLPMPRISGIEAQKKIKKISIDVEVNNVTGLGTLTHAVKAIRCGQVFSLS